MNKIDIEYFIKQFASILPEHETVRTEITFISGKELMLTGVKTFKGEPIEPGVTYELEIPVLKATHEIDGEPVLKVIDHKHRMRTAWLSGGLNEVYEYLLPYLGKDQLQHVKKTFMRVHNKPLPTVQR